MLLAVNAEHAVAALGQVPLESSASVPTAVASGARLLSTVGQGRTSQYTLLETQLENGTTVREYATATGPVFAVSWSGPVLPDLNTLLGGYFSSFQLEAERARNQGRRGSPINMTHDGLVIRSNGRMRNFFGHAYVPVLVPAGLDMKNVLQ